MVIAASPSELSLSTTNTTAQFNRELKAEGYGERKGITHAAWRALGVPPDVLRKAGISRGA